MIEELMAQLDQELKLTKQQVKTLKSHVNEAKKKMEFVDKQPVTEQIQNNYIQKQTPAFSLYKADRFKQSEKKKDNQDQFNISQTSFLTTSSVIANCIRPNPQQVVFPKSERFKQEIKQDERNYNINLDAVKRKQPSAVITTPQQQRKKTRKQELIKQSQISAEPSGYNDDDLETQASISQIEPGPGYYNANFKVIEPQKGIALSKCDRFQQTKKTTVDTELNPNYEVVKPKAPGVFIKKEQPKTKQQIKKEKEKEQLEIQKAEAYIKRPKEIDQYFRKNIPNGILQQNLVEIGAAPPGSKERRFQMFILLDRLREMRKRGPAGYEVKEIQPAVHCLVVYKRSKSAEDKPRAKISDILGTPGPNYYYWKDDLLHEAQPAYTFNKVPRVKRISLDDLDLKSDLNPNADFVKPRAPAAVINQEHKEKQLTVDEIIKMKMGPGAYEAKFKLVEKRNDIGIVKFPELNDFNAREIQMDLNNNKEQFDNEDLNPNIDAIKPAIKTFKYHEDTEIQPEHPPDALIYQEHFKFYDVDLNVVKDDVTKGGDFSNKLNIDEFKEHEEFMQLMHGYFERQKKAPTIGSYNPKYKIVDPKIVVPNFDNYVEKDNDPIEKPEGDVDGDNLILNPRLPEKHIPNVNIKKMEGRKEDDEAAQDYKEEGIIQPNYNQVQKKVKGFVELKKQLPRPEYEEEQKKEENKEVIDVKVNYNQIEPKVKGYVNIGKVMQREDDPNYEPKSKNQEINIEVNREAVQPRVKGGSSMSKGASRFK